MYIYIYIHTYIYIYIYIYREREREIPSSCTGSRGKAPDGLKSELSLRGVSKHLLLSAAPLWTDCTNWITLEDWIEVQTLRVGC